MFISHLQIQNSAPSPHFFHSIGMSVHQFSNLRSQIYQSPFMVEILVFVEKSHPTLKLVSFFPFFLLAFLQYFKIFIFNLLGFNCPDATCWSVPLFHAGLQRHLYPMPVLHVSAHLPLWECGVARECADLPSQRSYFGNPNHCEAYVTGREKRQVPLRAARRSISPNYGEHRNLGLVLGGSLLTLCPKSIRTAGPD